MPKKQVRPQDVVVGFVFYSKCRKVLKKVGKSVKNFKKTVKKLDIYNKIW